MKRKWSFEMKGVTKWFPPEQLLFERIDFRVTAHEVVLLKGTAGSGRTVLMQLIEGSVAPDEGNIERYGRISVIPKHVGWLESMTLQQHVMLPLLAKGDSWSKSKLKAGRLLLDIGMWERRHLHPSQLTAYEKALGTFCQAVVTEPRIVIADEFLHTLTDEECERIWPHIDKLLDFSALLLMADREYENYDFSRIITMDELKSNQGNKGVESDEF